MGLHGHKHEHGTGHRQAPDHAHGHDHRSMGELGRQALIVALVLNFGFLFVEAGVGFWTSSLALISDAVHMLTDVMALVIAIFAATARKRPRSATATWGNARVAVLGGLANGVLGIGAAIWIVLEAVERFQAPPELPGFPVLVTAVVGLLVNLVSAWWLHRSGDRGVNMRGALLHMLGDALGSVAAIIAGATLMLGGPALIDPVVSIVVALVVVASAVPLLRDVVHILLERAPRGLDQVAVRDLLRGHNEVKDILGFHAWALDDGETIASFVIVTEESDLGVLAGVADHLREHLADHYGIVHTTIEWRPLAHARPCCDDEGTAKEASDHGDHRHQPAA